MLRLGSAPRLLSRTGVAPPTLRANLQPRHIHSTRPANNAPLPSTPPPTGSGPLPAAPFPQAAKTKQRPFWRRHPYWTTLLVSPVVILASGTVCIGGLLAYDATTYMEKHVDNVPEEVMHFNLGRGGKKNLKIADHQVDDTDPNRRACDGKQRLVIVGGGWGSVGVIKHLDPNQWHVTVVAPENYFLFHPLLPSATVGTVEVRSLVEPLRKIIARVSGHFLQARAVDVDFQERLLEVQSADGSESFYVPYDRLILAQGSVNSTHGVPGLEHCFQLKTVQDAQAIRRRVMDNLERAALPSTEEAERRRLLSFVVCGGGPTGVEFASELFDMVNEDVLDYMPKILRDQISVHIIQSRDHILNTYAETISQYAEERFKRNEIDTILNARVKSVDEDKVTYTTKGPDGKPVEHTIDCGFTLWSTGIAMNPFTEKVASLLPNQYHAKALEVDSQLRVLGTPLNTVYALGDAATIETRLVDHLLEMVDACDTDKDGKIDDKEFQQMMKMIDKKFPTASIHRDKIEDIFDKYANAEHVLGLNELAEMFIHISKKMTNLPATAQVANSQGTYLGKKLSKIGRLASAEKLDMKDIPDDEDVYKPFKHVNMGSLAYIGNSAVFDAGGGWSFAGDLWAMYLWRSVYWSEQVSFRSRCLLMFDWIKRGIWGRDLSKM